MWLSWIRLLNCISQTWVRFPVMVFFFFKFLATLLLKRTVNNYLSMTPHFKAPILFFFFFRMSNSLKLQKPKKNPWLPTSRPLVSLFFLFVFLDYKQQNQNSNKFQSLIWIILLHPGTPDSDRYRFLFLFLL